MARRPARSRFIRPAPKTKIWFQTGFDETTLVTNSAQLLATANAALLAVRPFTILRTRIVVNSRSDQSVASEGMVGAFGMIIVKETATTIGVTAIPTPLTDPDADWYVYQGLFGMSELDGTGNTFSWNPGYNWVIDSKAMRKVGPTDDIAWVSEIRNQGGGLFNIEGRTLIQLH